MPHKAYTYLLTILFCLCISNLSNAQENKASKSFNQHHKSRNIYLNVADYFAGSISLGYEYISKNGNYSFRLPLAVGINALKKENLTRETHNEMWRRQAYYRVNKQWGTGLECYFYPRGFGNFKYYWGPSIELGWFKYQRTMTIYIPGYVLGKHQVVDNLGLYQSVLIHQGIVFQPKPRLNFNMGIGLGVCRGRYRMHDQNGLRLKDDVRDEIAVRYMLTVSYKLF